VTITEIVKSPEAQRLLPVLRILTAINPDTGSGKSTVQAIAELLAGQADGPFPDPVWQNLGRQCDDHQALAQALIDRAKSLKTSITAGYIKYPPLTGV